MPVSALLYAGKRTTQTLNKLGIRTIGDLARSDRYEIGKVLGKGGDQLWKYANGMDKEPVASFYAPKEVKSVGNGMTFRQDIKGEQEIKAGIAVLADSVAARLRADNLKCRTVQVQIKDPNFKVIQRQMQFPRPTYLHREIAQAAFELIYANWSMTAPIRLLAITGADLISTDEPIEQVGLFEAPDKENHDKLERLEDAMASIRKKYGHQSIGYGQQSKKDTRSDDTI